MPIMDYSHRRINSAAVPHAQVARDASGSSGYQQRPSPHQCGASYAGTYYEYIQSLEQSRPTEAGQTSYRIASGSNHSHVDSRRADPVYTQPRSRAYSSPYKDDRFPKPPTSHARGASHAGYVGHTPRPSLAHSEALPRTRPSLQRPDSGSSMSSYASVTTPPTDRSSWSTATTPEPMSPTSPHTRPLLQSPLRKLSQDSVTLDCGELSPESVPVRPVRPTRTSSRSISRRFHNTPIEVPVPEEEESSERRSRQVPAREENGVDSEFMTPPDDQATKDAVEASNLHQRRQNRQQKMATYTAFPQAPKSTLPALPPLPLPAQGARIPSTPAAPRRLNREASRSLPQLRGCIGPPPSEPLPPLPPVPQISPMFPSSSPTTPTTVTAPDLAASPSTFTPEICSPPAPTLPPPPPPAGDDISTTSAVKDSTEVCTPGKMEHQLPRMPIQTPEERWEEELQRHKQLLKSLPTQAEPPRERLKLSRSYKSLGNLRARARAHSTATARDDIVTTSGIAHTLSKSHKSKISRTSVSKAQREPAGRLDEPLPPLPKAEETGLEPIVSVFEDDSDDEGDTVRRFVRNIFSRRTRSSDAVTMLSSESSSKVEEANHNSRKKNYSSSSSFSLATTVGASTVSSSTTTIAPTISEASSTIDSDNSQTNSLVETGSSRSSTEQPRQRGPLLTRMFVRRSH